MGGSTTNHFYGLNFVSWSMAQLYRRRPKWPWPVVPRGLGPWRMGGRHRPGSRIFGLGQSGAKWIKWICIHNITYIYIYILCVDHIFKISQTTDVGDVFVDTKPRLCQRTSVFHPRWSDLHTSRFTCSKATSSVCDAVYVKCPKVVPSVF